MKKKLLLFILLLSFSILLTGCMGGSGNPGNTDDGTDPVDIEDETSAVEALNTFVRYASLEDERLEQFIPSQGIKTVENVFVESEPDYETKDEFLYNDPEEIITYLITDIITEKKNDKVIIRGEEFFMSVFLNTPSSYSGVSTLSNNTFINDNFELTYPQEYNSFNLYADGNHPGKLVSIENTNDTFVYSAYEGRISYSNSTAEDFLENIKDSYLNPSNNFKISNLEHNFDSPENIISVNGNKMTNIKLEFDLKYKPFLVEVVLRENGDSYLIEETTVTESKEFVERRIEQVIRVGFKNEKLYATLMYNKDSKYNKEVTNQIINSFVIK